MAYWDRISATKPLPEVIDLMTRLINEQLGNPQSPHRLGSHAAGILAAARQQVADLIHAGPAEITFTSSGSEANNMAILGLAQSAARKRSGRKILVSAIEHVSVMKPAQQLEKQGFSLQVLPVDAKGRILHEQYMSALTDDVLLVSVQLANPEVGTVQDIALLSEPARRKGVVFHTDAVDAAGWIPVDVEALGVDALTISANPMHGPQGAAALYVRHQTGIAPLMFGGIQERNRRPGLENIPAIAGFGLAAEIAAGKLAERMSCGEQLARRMKTGLAGLESVEMTGDWDRRIPGHVSLIVDYVEGEALLLMLDMHGISAASGSSCTAKDLKISPVLMAMGLEHSRAQGSLVFTSSWDTRDEDVDAVVTAMPKIVGRLRQMSPLWKQTNSN